MAREEVIMAFDCELTGNNLEKHSCVAIGIAVLDMNGKTIVKKRFSMTMIPDSTFDPGCKKYFWDKNQKLWDDIQKDADHPTKVMTDVKHFIHDHHKKYDVFTIVDNPEDYMWVNYYLNYYGDSDGIPFDHTGQLVRFTRCTTSYVRGRELIPINADTPDEDVFIKKYNLDMGSTRHDHYPENDAEFIALFYIRMNSRQTMTKEVYVPTFGFGIIPAFLRFLGFK